MSEREVERALVQEYAALLAHTEPWQIMPAAEPGERDYFLGARHALERLAARLGLKELDKRAAQHAAREEEELAREGLPPVRQ